MAGYFTTKRDLRNEYHQKDGTYFFLAGGGPLGPVTRKQAGTAPRNSQTTYSYRSGGAHELGEIDPVDLIRDNHKKNIFPHDTGHEFWTQKVVSSATHKDFEAHGNSNAYFKGPLILNRAWPSQPTYDFGPVDSSVGTRLLATARPTKSAANLARALGELIVDLPVIPLTTFANFHHPKQFTEFISKEFLGYEFAWAPLISDIQTVLRAVLTADKIISQYERDNGRLIRRRRENLPKSTTTTEVLSTAGGNPYVLTIDPRSLFGQSFFSSVPSDSRGELSLTKIDTEEYWFSGAYTYKMMGEESSIASMGRIAQQADHVLGLKLDLDVLWQLSPWSWLIDWFSNIGSIIALNSSIAEDNLVIAYGYLMRTSVHIEEYRHSGLRFVNGATTGPITNRMTIVRKERVRVNPYGFAIAPNIYSDVQWAILAALGLTKAPRKLWWG